LKWRVEDKEYNVSELTERERTELYKRLYEERPSIECLCNESNGHFPHLHIKKRHQYFPVNNPTNSKNGIQHADDCILNTYYRNFLSKKGINILDDGTISCKLKGIKKEVKTKASIIGSKNPNSKPHSLPNAGTHRKASLRTLFFALLQKYDVHCYRLDQKRNVGRRLYKAICEAIVDNESLKTVGYLTHTKYKYNFKKHKLIIGWPTKKILLRMKEVFGRFLYIA
jgi:hypothetical protein